MTERPFFSTRRDFLSGSLTLLSAASTLPLFLGRTAAALAGQDEGKPERKKPHERILVVVQLAGGNDGLNTVIPYNNDFYRKYRPRLAVDKKDVLRLNDEVGLHPAAEGLKALFDEGRMAIVQGVGYPNPNRSHFSSTDIWESADPTLRKHDGWLGRYFDAACKGSDPDPILGVALTQETPLALTGEHFSPLAFENPDVLTWRAGERDPRALEAFRKLNNIEGDINPTGNRLRDYLQRAALKALVGADEIRAATGSDLRTGPRGRRRGQGGALAQSLQTVAKMIAADLPTRIYYVSMGGFDTHSAQDARHRQLLTQFGNAMTDFIDDLAEQKLLDRVLVLTFSEFGRRVQENASGGTDHGEAAPMMLFGSKLLPGVHEKHPDLSKLNRGDLAFGCDFRRVYASVLRDWLKTRPELALGGNFNPLRLIKA